jgi:alpha-tubulin suppressor-like RCC1 family protein
VDDIIDVPTKIKLLPKVINMTAGWCHALVYTYDQRMFGWGDASSGNLGIGPQDEQTYRTVTEIKDAPSKVVMMSCGCYSSCVLYE